MAAFIKPLSALCARILLGATQPGSSPEGRWLTEEKNGIVEIFRCSGGDVLLELTPLNRTRDGLRENVLAG